MAKKILLDSNGKAVMDSSGAIMLASGGGIDTTDATATANDILLGKTAYVNDIKVEGSIETYDGSNSEMTEPLQSTLKKLLDTTKSCQCLFQKYKGTSVDDLIKYDDTENVTNMSYMFSICSKLTTIPQLNTSNVTDMSSMFNYCTNLQTIPQLDTSKVTNMFYLFYACANLQTIPLLDTSKVTNMCSMFNSCINLQTIPQLDTSKVTDMSSTFNNCTNLQTLDITSLDKITSTGNISRVADSCYSLTKFIIRTMTVIPPLNTNSFESCYHFTGKVSSKYNPEGLKDGRIYVPDDKVEQLKTATNWSAYADIIVPLSTLEE